MGRIADRLQRRYGEARDARKQQRVEHETRDEIRRMRRDLKPKSDTGQKVVVAFRKGFGDIGKSLATANTNRRPKIANMPGKRPDIATQPNLSKLKSRHFGKDIRRR